MFFQKKTRTPFLLPSYFFVILCVTREFVKVVKAKSVKLLICARVREYYCPGGKA